MNVIGRHHMVEHRKSEAFLGLENAGKAPCRGLELKWEMTYVFCKRFERSAAVERFERLELSTGGSGA